METTFVYLRREETQRPQRPRGKPRVNKPSTLHRSIVKVRLLLFVLKDPSARTWFEALFLTLIFLKSGPVGRRGEIYEKKSQETSGQFRHQIERKTSRKKTRELLIHHSLASPLSDENIERSSPNFFIVTPSRGYHGKPDLKESRFDILLSPRVESSFLLFPSVSLASRTSSQRANSFERSRQRETASDDTTVNQQASPLSPSNPWKKEESDLSLSSFRFLESSTHHPLY